MLTSSTADLLHLATDPGLEQERSSYGAGATVRAAERMLFAVLFLGFFVMSGGFLAQLAGQGGLGGEAADTVACTVSTCAPRG